MIDVLLVEDSEGDARLASEALRDAGLEARLHVVGDGEAAMAFLRGEGEHAGAPRPDLVLLDLNLPRKDGREVLREIEADEALRAIPVVVLTSSSQEGDILHSYRLSASSYLTKPPSGAELLSVVRSIAPIGRG